MTEEINSHYQQMIENCTLPQFNDYHFDQNLTAETYITVIRKMLACVRHECYLECQKVFSDPSKKSLTEAECEEMLSRMQETKQEEYRLRILQKHNIEVPVGCPPKRIMQKAYLTYATQRPNGLENNKPWMEKVQHEHQIHAKIFDKICKNEKIEGIEENPMDGQDVESYEAALVQGTLIKNVSAKGVEEVTLQPSASSIDEADQLLSKHKKTRAAAEVIESQAESSSVNAESAQQEPVAQEEVKQEEQSQAVASQGVAENQPES